MSFYDQLRQLQAKSQMEQGGGGDSGMPRGGGMSPMRPNQPRPMVAPQMQGQTDRGNVIREGQGGNPPGKPGGANGELTPGGMDDLKARMNDARDRRARARAACMAGNQMGCAYAEKFEQEMQDIQYEIDRLREQENYARDTERAGQERKDSAEASRREEYQQLRDSGYMPGYGNQNLRRLGRP